MDFMPSTERNTFPILGFFVSSIFMTASCLEMSEPGSLRYFDGFYNLHNAFAIDECCNRSRKACRHCNFSEAISLFQFRYPGPILPVSFATKEKSYLRARLRILKMPVSILEAALFRLFSANTCPAAEKTKNAVITNTKRFISPLLNPPSQPCSLQHLSSSNSQ